MKNKEQLLYFFLQGKISLSQYDYKFMSNLQSMIHRDNRVTSNQTKLFDNLISKYKKQLTKLGYDKDELKQLVWKAMVVESTPEYTGANLYLNDDEIVLRVPFNKTFISKFREVAYNTFEWDKMNKVYKSPYSTIALKIGMSIPPLYFSSMRTCDTISAINKELEPYKNTCWTPTLMKVNNRFIIGAINEVLYDLIKDVDLQDITPKMLFLLSELGISIDKSIYENDNKLEFSANRIYEIEIEDLENTISWMKNIGCEHVVIGRGLRYASTQINDMITKYGMNPLGPMSYGNLPSGTSMLIQQVSNTETRHSFYGSISKIIVIKDSNPIEIK